MPHFSFLDLKILQIQDTFVAGKKNKQTSSAAPPSTASTTGVPSAYAPTGAQTRLGHLVQTSSTRPQSLPTSHTTADAGQPSRAMTFFLSSHVDEMHGPLTRSVGHVIASPPSPIPPSFQLQFSQSRRPRQTDKQVSGPCARALATALALAHAPRRTRHLPSPSVAPNHALVSVSCV